MRLWLASLLFVPVAAREQITTVTALEGVLDERKTYVPLGYNQIFNCEAETKASLFIRGQPRWNVLFFDPATNQMERVDVSSVRNATNERFRQLDNSSLLLIGAQKWHHEVVLECVLEFGSSSSAVSRHVIVVQDCSEDVDRNPCLYGGCAVKGFLNVFEVARCDCIPGFTGNFCSVYAEDTALKLALFYSPLVFLLVVILAVFCIRKKVEFVGKQRPMRTERQITKFNPLPDTKSRYPSAYFTVNERTVEVSAKELSKEEKTQEGLSKKSKLNARSSKSSQETKKQKK